MDQIVKIEEEDMYGLFAKQIFGLNALRVNDVDYTISPNTVFLRALCRENNCSAHVGTLALEGEEPEEFFDTRFVRESIRTPVGLYNGLFYSVEPGLESTFFLTVLPDFIAKYSDYLLSYDALAIYVCDIDYSDSQHEEVQQFLRSLEIPALEPKAQDIASEQWEVIRRNQEYWLQTVLNLCRLVILSSSDGWNLKIYTRESANFDLILSPLNEAVSSIQACSWYQEHKELLRWDDENDQCLKLR